MYIPERPKIYHILRFDSLPLIVSGEKLLSDKKTREQNSINPNTIGIPAIKNRRLYELTLTPYMDLHVGECVPFYFCFRSVMLYYLSRNNGDSPFRGTQEDIIHLECDMFEVIKWAEEHGLRWAFTNGNAGSYFFESFNRIEDLTRLNWDAIYAHYWMEVKDSKQSEFLIENECSWELVRHIGTYSKAKQQEVKNIIAQSSHKPQITVEPTWYY